MKIRIIQLALLGLACVITTDSLAESGQILLKDEGILRLRADDNVRGSLPHLDETRARLAMDRRELDTSDHKNIVQWRHYVDSLRRKDKLAIVRVINSQVNKKIRYEEDWKGYGKKEFWARPSETLKRLSGDCEDIALLKIFSLWRAGFKKDELAIIVGLLEGRKGKIGHAMAGVRFDSDGDGRVEHHLLTNGTSTISRPGQIKLAFTPMYAVTPTQGTWVLRDIAGSN